MSAKNMPAGEPGRQPAKYQQVVSLCASTPWAIRAEKLVAIREMLAVRASGARFSAEEIQARIGAGPAQKQDSSVGTVAIIPVYGVITPRADLFTEMSGGTSMQGFMDSLRSAAADDSIGAILLDVDSPGGMTDLVPEAAAEIRSARASKPVVAIANTDAASAAYWLGSQASEFVVTPSGMVGSIGVFAAHDDVSAAMEQDGVKTTLISAGKFKVEANPFEPLTDEARAAIQARVDSFYAMFTRDVAKGRGVSVDAVRGGFGEGRIVTAQDAVKAGMVDRVDTFESTVQRLIVEAAGGNRSRQVAFSTGYVSVPKFSNAATFTIDSSTFSSQPPGVITPNEGRSELGYPPSTDTPEAATSGLSFVATGRDLRLRADKFVHDARSLNGTRRSRFTAAKRDEMQADSEALIAAGTALAELVAESDADPGADALARRLLADAQRRHFPTTGAAR